MVVQGEGAASYEQGTPVLLSQPKEIRRTKLAMQQRLREREETGDGVRGVRGEGVGVLRFQLSG